MPAEVLTRYGGEPATQAGQLASEQVSGGGIVVGYDDSAGSRQALKWAASEARARSAILTVCVVQQPLRADALAAAAPEPGAGDRVLKAGQRLAHDLMMGEQDVRPSLVEGRPAEVLCTRFPGAEMIVVGARGSDGIPGLPVGSVSLKVAANAPGRVVVIRGGWQAVPGHAPLPIAVGTDGSPGCEAAVAFAFDEAALRGTYLLAVCALADCAGVLGTAGQIRSDSERQISRYERAHPDVAVRRTVSQGPARPALLEAAAGAQLVVVGARGRGGFADMPIGSVSLAVLSYAKCPVGVVRSGDQP